MNNRTFDGIAIIIAFALTLSVAWIESSAFEMSDRLAFVGLSGLAVLWFVSAVYSKVPMSANQITPLVDDQFQSLFPDEVSSEFKAEEEQFKADLDAEIARLEAKNPIAAAMTETELLHYLVDCLDRPIEDAQPKEVTPIQVVPSVEEVKPKKTRARTAAKTKSSAAATATVKTDDKPKARSTATGKTRSTTKKTTTASSKSRSTKKSGGSNEQ